MLGHLALQLIHDACRCICFDDRDHLVTLLRLQVSHESRDSHLPTSHPDSDVITLSKAFQDSADPDPFCLTLYYKVPSFRRSRNDYLNKVRNIDCSDLGCVVWS
jgi:hypothetical protein